MQKFLVQLIRNSTGEVSESYNYGDEASAQAHLDQLGDTGKYGQDKEFSLVLHDDSANASQELEVSDRSEDRTFCLKVIDTIAAYNKKYFSKAQVMSLASTPAFGGIIMLLLTGGIETARDAVAAAGPSLYPADFVTKVLGMIDAQIAKNAPPEEPQDETENPPEGESSSQPV